MRYEIKEGHPADCPKRPCEIGAYENNELMATYNGFYDPRRGTWVLYPKKRYALPDGVDVSYFDYALMETLDNPESSCAHGDLFAFADRCGCKLGVAHTDLFRFIRSIGEDPFAYFVRMRERGIFWEMNISHDSIHSYREHPYMLEFFQNEEQQDIVRRSGVEISIGFDGHRVGEYPGERVVRFCRMAENLGLRFAFAC